MQISTYEKINFSTQMAGISKEMSEFEKNLKRNNYNFIDVVICVNGFVNFFLDKYMKYDIEYIKMEQLYRIIKIIPKYFKELNDKIFNEIYENIKLYRSEIYIFIENVGKDPNESAQEYFKRFCEETKSFNDKLKEIIKQYEGFDEIKNKALGKLRDFKTCEKRLRRLTQSDCEQFDNIFYENKKKLFEEETKRFLHLIRDKPWDEDVKRILIVLLFTGMRIGECLGLAWEDIDFEKKTIFIHHTLSCVDGECYLDSPKTKSSIRLVAMNSTVEKCLRDQQAYVEQLKLALGNKYAHPEMVFPSGLGNYRDRCSVYHSLKRMTKVTEFEDMTLHKLRHCNATLLLNSGVDLKVISEHLGHCDIGVTANIYADVLQKQKIRLADTIDDKLSDELT